jgi:catechol 2,3-dioxygenase-like lactoylglutathione lyase family enzyme
LITSLCACAIWGDPHSGTSTFLVSNAGTKGCGTEFPFSLAKEQPRSPFFQLAKSRPHPTALLHLAFRANRENFLVAQEELKRRDIHFEFEDHDISHSIYFRDPDGHRLEITTYELG